jgi:CHAD domain-containing protein
VNEVELLIPEGLASERLAAVISSSGMVAEEAGTGSGRRTYYDTFDGRLRTHGGPAVYVDGRLALNGTSAELERPPERMLAADLQPGPLRDALSPLIDVRALLPLAELQIKERRLRILDAERKTVVRASIEEATLGQSGAELRRRVRLVALRGYDRELERVRGVLARELRLEPSPLSLIDEAVTALGGKPGGVSSKVAVQLHFGQRADAAAIAVLGRLLEVIEQNVEGTIADLDSEFLHDLRVAVRRSRSVQRQLRLVFPPEALERTRAEFRWIQSVTGESRDLDVYLLGFEDMRALVSASMRADLDPLREVLASRRTAARKRMVADLSSDRFTTIRRDWAVLLDRLASLPENERPDAAVPIGPLVGRRIANVYGQMVRDGAVIDERGPSEPFHELRKRGKELRYLLELFGLSLYPPQVVRPMIKTLKALQDVLGRHQDREVQTATLGAMAVDLAGDQSALLATGALIARLDDDKWAARTEFAACFARFASREQRALVKDTFA